MKVAVAAPGTTNAATLWQALIKGGLKWSDANPVSLGFPQHVVAFGNKGIDAGITVEPLATVAIKKGVAVRYAGSNEIYPDHQTAAILYTTTFIKAKPQLAHKFMRAYIKAVRDYNDALRGGRITGAGADEVIATIIGYSKVQNAGLLREITPHACDPNGRVRTDSIAQDLRFFKELKLINNPEMKAQDIIDDSFAKRVVDELGPYKRKT
jgi:NitT/TauT family transport system substrate-binding protein